MAFVFSSCGLREGRYSVTGICVRVWAFDNVSCRPIGVNFSSLGIGPTVFYIIHNVLKSRNYVSAD